MAEGTNVGRWVAGLGLALLFAGALVFATRQEAALECEVCMVFEGREACRTGRGRDRDAALRGAVSTACAVLSDGVTRGMACNRTPPRSVVCND